MRKLVCWFVGHDADFGFADAYDLYRCDRCGKINPPESWLARLLRKIKHRWHWRVGVWLERCPDCGLRFKKHDNSVEHLPF